MASDATSDDLAAVLRWESSGGDVEILELGPPLVVSLCACDGGQEMHRIVSDAADLRAHLDAGGPTGTQPPHSPART